MDEIVQLDEQSTNCIWSLGALDIFHPSTSVALVVPDVWDVIPMLLLSS